MRRACVFVLRGLALCLTLPRAVFNGVTISTLLYIVFCLLTYYLGQRTVVAKADPERRQRFKTRVLNMFIWGA